MEVHGIEHDHHLVELARAQGLDVTEGFTETEDTRFAGGLYDVFLSLIPGAPAGPQHHASRPYTATLEDGCHGAYHSPKL